MLFLLILFLILLFVLFFFVGFPKEKENISWGVNFSAKHAKDLGLDSRKTYINLLDDLNVKKIKIAVHWDEIEKDEGVFDFEELDFQFEEAKKRNANIFLVVGMKTPRWPECHIPYWAKNLYKDKQQEKILNMIEKVVLRYKDDVSFFQVENEPLFAFGDCPWADVDFLKKEINFVKSLTNNKPVLISTTGEFSFWFRVASLGDMIGVTTYKKVWFSEFSRHFTYPIPATFYRRRALLIKWLFNKEVIGVELQAEPWGSTLLYYSPLEEQMKSMDINQFKKNISFGKKIGFRETYLWGAEWWYYMKEKHNNSTYLEEAKKLWQ